MIGGQLELIDTGTGGAVTGSYRAPRLTGPRRRALAVMAAADGSPQLPRSSNRTSKAEDGPPWSIYWQVADWLIEQGLVVWADEPYHLRLTPAGRDLARRTTR